MREALKGALIGLAVLILAGAIASRTGGAQIAAPRASGTGPWMVVRASGFAAFAALSLDMIVGLALSTRVAAHRLPRGSLIALHSWLSPLALALVLGHAAVLLADSYLRFDAVDLLIPFAAPYRPIATGLGTLAGYAALVVHASFAFRRRLGTRMWRRLHYLSFVAFLAGALHGFFAGTDAGRSWAVVLLAGPLVIASALVALRVRAAVHRSRSAAA